ncbi:MFS transporter [Streptomyces sp. NPDC003781]|uniref:MFS transporter n=1 Tax=Streptomyces sp. NPDC003781 TaxID=3364686 RepID=UPI0036CC387B
MLILGHAVMVAGALVSAVTNELLVMITGRTLQGFAMSAIPLGISLARDIVPREELGSAMALISSSMGVGGGCLYVFRQARRGVLGS